MLPYNEENGRPRPEHSLWPEPRDNVGRWTPQTVAAHHLQAFFCLFVTARGITMGNYHKLLSLHHLIFLPSSVVLPIRFEVRGARGTAAFHLSQDVLPCAIKKKLLRSLIEDAVNITTGMCCRGPNQPTNQTIDLLETVQYFRAYLISYSDRQAESLPTRRSSDGRNIWSFDNKKRRSCEKSYCQESSP